MSFLSVIDETALVVTRKKGARTKKIRYYTERPITSYRNRAMFSFSIRQPSKESVMSLYPQVSERDTSALIL